VDIPYSVIPLDNTHRKYSNTKTTWATGIEKCPY